MESRVAPNCTPVEARSCSMHTCELQLRLRACRKLTGDQVGLQEGTC